jgi:hypothetical protein
MLFFELRPAVFTAIVFVVAICLFVVNQQAQAKPDEN